MLRKFGRPYDPNRPGERIGPNPYMPVTFYPPAPLVVWIMFIIHVMIVVLLTGFLSFHNTPLYVALIVFQTILFELALIYTRRYDG